MTTLRQLRFLVALADELNFSRAADACHVTQPTLSAGLKELEASLGASLAERTRRSVILTGLGRTIADRARTVLAEVRDIEDLAARCSGPLQGKVTLGTIPTIGPFLIPRALPLIRRQFPELKLFLREELTESLVDGLVEGRLDAVLMALPFEIGDLETAPLFEDGYQLVTPLKHPILGHGQVAGPELAGTPLLLLEKGHCLQRHALSAFPDVLIQQDETFSATSLNTLVAMVEEGLGITLLPQMAIDAGIASGHAVALTPLKGACPRRIVLAWRRTSAHAEDFRRLAGIFREVRH
ncbi:MAG: LysR family transcriptional regulator [Bauldia sp.]|nr:LysR family transcriptional regulator [Bauldia sp.]